MTPKTKTVGLIGYGSFGELVARMLQDHVQVKVSSRNSDKVPVHMRASLEEVAACDYVIPTIPLSAYKSVLGSLASCISPTTVVVDICSVKVLPSQLITELLPHNKLVSTHPLFGPQTVADGFDNLTMVICDEESDASEALVVDAFCKRLGLRVVHMSADEHDKQMAKVHALTFYIARGLFGLGLDHVDLKTPSFQRLESLIQLEHSHTSDLFETIQLGNPYAAEIREQFLRSLQKLDTEIRESKKEY